MFINMQIGEVGNNILNILNKRDISIRKMSIDLGMDYSFAHALVNRRSLGTTKLVTVLKVANYLDVSIYDLFEEEQKNSAIINSL